MPSEQVPRAPLQSVLAGLLRKVQSLVLAVLLHSLVDQPQVVVEIEEGNRP